ncbi:MAG: hypothetical protein HOG76_10215 [Candidatus Marinimicrobia bacterium]|nr:hypothetical protein [Candidatus Neomarinimicrobiota bacterium]MBT4130408.1 hypothetical protein [Candidatus Neomarinimicrobiota bacterium]MBT4419375.1 hypothetical protein [Candidatus Neomarinimicrobiota bacterium]MBT5268706.1 hypothetical protein [Candidatus Neomarinimicrobiota bacterium]MBT6003197.1 hypothetical protein [Candidatus Neomarinimicrobiota bacterium]
MMKPILAIPRHYLLLISGLMWSGVGLMLILLATRWLGDLDIRYPGLIIVAGVIPGLLVSIYGFARIVGKNIQRIEDMGSRASIFAFQAWQSYLLIVIMMSMGAYVRHSGLIPMLLKTPGYFTIGTALSFSSIDYYKAFFRSIS